VDHPRFVPIEEASEWVAPWEPVIVFEHEGEARAYPIQILLFHELVNDRIGDLPFLVSFCPLCNSGLVFDRRVDGETYEFGVAGLLRHSDMIMHDRQTESLWQQVTGEALVGALTGKRLRPLTSQTVSFLTFAETFPEGRVLARPDPRAPYGISHYEGYEFGPRRNRAPVPLRKPLPVPALERVVVVRIDGRTRAYPFSDLSVWRKREDKIGGTRFVIFFEPGMVSAMDAKQVEESREVGAAGVFSPFLDGKRLKFKEKDGKIVDKQTGSVWNVAGLAVEGPLKGQRLDPVPHSVLFTFAAAVFDPSTVFVGANLDSGLPAGSQGTPPGAAQPGPTQPGAPQPGGPQSNPFP